MAWSFGKTLMRADTSEIDHILRVASPNFPKVSTSNNSISFEPTAVDKATQENNLTQMVEEDE